MIMNKTFETCTIAPHADTIAPDGAEVRLLLSLRGGSMAHFQLAPGQISRAVAHHTVEEIWYFLAGQGRMWRRLGRLEEVVAVRKGVCIAIPVGTHFQFRAEGRLPLGAVAITMPPWPGEAEAYYVTGKW